jgi:hypothetical protein
MHAVDFKLWLFIGWTLIIKDLEQSPPTKDEITLQLECMRDKPDFNAKPQQIDRV